MIHQHQSRRAACDTETVPQAARLPRLPRSLFAAMAFMILINLLFTIAPLQRLLQIPSGCMASFFLGAPAEFDGSVVQIFTQPRLTVSTACSGVRLFAILSGLGAGYWCGRRRLRWLALLPLCYGITLFSNSARIAAAWQFRRISDGLLPDWLQEFAHMGIGMAWSLTIIAVLVYWMSRKPQPVKETNR